MIMQDDQLFLKMRLYGDLMTTGISKGFLQLVVSENHVSAGIASTLDLS
jgi:hypothetical protein